MDKFDIAFWISLIGSWCFVIPDDNLKEGVAKVLCHFCRVLFLGASIGFLIGGFFN